MSRAIDKKVFRSRTASEKRLIQIQRETEEPPNLIPSKRFSSYLFISDRILVVILVFYVFFHFISYNSRFRVPGLVIIN